MLCYEIEVRSFFSKNSDFAIILEQEILLNEKVIFSAEVQLVYIENGKISRIPNKFKEILSKIS